MSVRRRTRKWIFVAQEAVRLAGLGLGRSEIARRLDVDRSTVTRWIAAGKIPGMKPLRGLVKSDIPRAPRTPAEWAKSVREAYDLDETDEQLVAIGQQSLALTLDEGVSSQTRLSAAARFQAIVKQLALVARKGAEEQPVVPPVAPMMVQERVSRRPTVDPRTRLMAVK